jgi:hypothetical protein
MTAWHRSPRQWIALALALAAIGCGYRPIVARVPGGGDRIAVGVVENQTSYAGLAGPLTTAIRKALARGGLELASANDRVPALEVVIVAVDGGPGMLGTTNDRLVPVDIVWRVSARARVVDPEGQARAGPVSLAVEGRSLEGGGVAAEAALGAREREELMDELAREIVRALLEEPDAADAPPADEAPLLL